MPAVDLTTVDKLRSWLNLTGEKDDVLLASLVTAASAFAENWMTRLILSASYVETLDGNASDRMILKQYPITAVSSVIVDGYSLPVSTAYNVAGYQFDDIGIYLIGYQFTRARRNVQISYTAGYASVPLDLEQAVIEICAQRYRERDRIGLVSKGLAGETTSFSQRDMSEGARSVLQYYQRVFPQ